MGGFYLPIEKGEQPQKYALSLNAEVRFKIFEVHALLIVIYSRFLPEREIST